ncbi:hypothetical protein ACLOJK_000656 [Asimina triloba]
MTWQMTKYLNKYAAEGAPNSGAPNGVHRWSTPSGAPSSSVLPAIVCFGERSFAGSAQIKGLNVVFGDDDAKPAALKGRVAASFPVAGERRTGDLL